MSQSRTGPKQHHYVPKSYLARFTDPAGFLRIYDRSTGMFRRQRPKVVMRINAYYRQSWVPEGVDPNIMETTLGEWLEAEAKNALDRLIERPASLTDDDTAILLVYLEVQRIRVPRHAEAAKAALRDAVLRLAPAPVLDAILSGRSQLTIKDSARFEGMRALIGKLGPWFSGMEWEVVTAADDASFVTTDSPVSFFHPLLPPPEEAGIALAGTMVFFPLSSRRALVMRHRSRSAMSENLSMEVLPIPEYEDGQIEIIIGAVWDKATVDGFNWRMAMLSSGLIVANDAEVLKRCIQDTGPIS